jgi:predicted DCC family thiol-disulfide oxidoreductase YuxK
MRVPNPPAKPLLVFDGDCGFCRTWVARWRRALGDHVAYEPFQTAAARFPTIPRARFRRAVQLILPDGQVLEAAEAVLRSLALAPDRRGGRRWLAAYRQMPGARPVFELGYRWVAEHRPMLGRISHFLYGPPPDDPCAAGPLPPARRSELAAARRRRRAAGAGLGAAMVLGGLAAWRWWGRRRSG